MSERSDASPASASPRLWRSLAEAQGVVPARSTVATPAVVDRRAFMKIMGASIALAQVGGCTRAPVDTIVPYRDGPDQATYGKPVYFASVLPHDGYGLGVLVETNMGRPTKIEGNPSHPGSGGATDVFRQAAVLELWDPDRSQAVRRGRDIATWNDFLAALDARLRAHGAAGLRLLTGMVASPSLHAMIGDVLARHPGARWHQWQPINRDNVLAGSALAMNARVDVLAHFDRARVVLAIDGDFLDEHPACVAHSLAFARTRAADSPLAARSRVYALECTPTLTGANADHRLPLRASDMEGALREIAYALGVLPTDPGTTLLPTAWRDAVVADLQRHAGGCIVTGGHRQPPAVHALVHAINERLGNTGRTLEYRTPVASAPVDHLGSLRELVDAMNDGAVDTLIMTGVNPVYTAPADLGFAAALARVPFKVHHGLYFDETAGQCDWHVPAAHPLESWGDLASFDGTLALQQPCIAPLFDGRTAHALCAATAGRTTSDARALVREFWSRRLPANEAAAFETALGEGVVTASAPAPRRAAEATTRAASVPSRSPPPSASADAIELVLAADPRVGDGAWANNAWLQELPKPLTQLAWDNAALMSPALAHRLGVRNEEVVELRLDGRSVTAPVWIMPGMPDRSVTLHLGYGRTRAGEVANGRGANAYALRTSTAPWFASGLTVSRTGRRQPLACAQTHHAMEGRDIVRTLTPGAAQACTQDCGTPHEREAPSLYRSPPSGPYAWAMSIDLSSCIGCGACTIACQAENNIPVVGPEEMRRGREMHWIRVDRYYEGPLANPRTLFQPVPCMHCEHAPCESVCPVEASVHDAQGLNVQVYNRCVGTRFCSNNCPYKVRRFNFFEYARDAPGLAAQRNPEVTVRMRGVMEKCNYCLQRITTARIAADAQGRALRDGDVITACQAACPTRAIVFGDLADPASEVRRRKSSVLDYALLAELNTRPRTTYLPRIAESPLAGTDAVRGALDASPPAHG